MSMEMRSWDQIPDDELLEWGNVPATIRKVDGEVERVLVISWDITPKGIVQLNRQVLIPVPSDEADDPDDHVPMRAPWRLLGEGEWVSIELGAISYDLETFLRQRDQAMAQMVRAAAAERLGLAGPGPGGR